VLRLRGIALNTNGVNFEIVLYTRTLAAENFLDEYLLLADT